MKSEAAVGAQRESEARGEGSRERVSRARTDRAPGQGQTGPLAVQAPHLWTSPAGARRTRGDLAKRRGPVTVVGRR